MTRPSFTTLNLSLVEPVYPDCHKVLSQRSYFKKNVLKFPNDPDEYPFMMDDFQYIDTLYTIRHVVKKYFHRSSGNVVAVKFLRYSSNERVLEHILREINTHRFASTSSYVVDFYGLCFYDGEALLVMECMDMSLKKLYEEVYKNNEQFSSDLLGLISVGLINCLTECNKLEILHRDLKPHNILINKSGEVKLCDFGEARIAVDFASTNDVGTYAYWAPEKFQLQLHYNKKSEIWSLGMTLAELALGNYPFEDELSELACYSPDFFRIKHILENANPLSIVRKISENMESRPDFCQFLESCLKIDHEERWSVEYLMETNWYKKYASFTDDGLFRRIRQSLNKLEINWPISNSDLNISSSNSEIGSASRLVNGGHDESRVSKFSRRFLPLILLFVVALIYIFLYFYFSLLFNK